MSHSIIDSSCLVKVGQSSVNIQLILHRILGQSSMVPTSTPGQARMYWRVKLDIYGHLLVSYHKKPSPKWSINFRHVSSISSVYMVKVGQCSVKWTKLQKVLDQSSLVPHDIISTDYELRCQNELTFIVYFSAKKKISPKEIYQYQTCLHQRLAVWQK